MIEIPWGSMGFLSSVEFQEFLDIFDTDNIHKIFLFFLSPRQL